MEYQFANLCHLLGGRLLLPCGSKSGDPLDPSRKKKKTDIQHPVFYWLDTWEPHIFIYLRIFLTFMIHEYTPKKEASS